MEAAKAHTKYGILCGTYETAALAQNRKVRLDLGELIHTVNTTVLQKLTDTQMVIGHQILKLELAFYNSAQEVAKHGVPGSQDIADDLGDRFVGPGGKAAKEAKAARFHANG